MNSIETNFFTKVAANGFDPDILSLPEEIQNSLYGLVEKNNNTGQGEPGNAIAQNDRSQSKKRTEPTATTEQRDIVR